MADNGAQRWTAFRWPTVAFRAKRKRMDVWYRRLRSWTTPLRTKQGRDDGTHELSLRAGRLCQARLRRSLDDADRLSFWLEFLIGEWRRVGRLDDDKGVIGRRVAGIASRGQALKTFVKLRPAGRCA